MGRDDGLDPRPDEDPETARILARRAEVVLGPEPSLPLPSFREYAARPDELLHGVQRAVESNGYQIIYVVPDEQRLRFRDTTWNNPRGTDIMCHLEPTPTGTRVAFRSERIPQVDLWGRGAAEGAAARVLRTLSRREEVARFTIEREKISMPWRKLTFFLSTAVFFIISWWL